MTDPVAPIVINGSHAEGGGVLLRTALATSALTQQPLRLHHVRGALRKPGIVSEDLCLIRALGAICAAELDGDELGSDHLLFAPTRPPRGLNQRLDIQAFESGTTPGNALIVLESLLPVLARSGVYSRVIVQGETHNPNALSFDAFDRVTLGAHRRQGLYAFANLAIAGFGYGAKGEVGLEVEPSAIAPLEWTKRGNLLRCSAVVTTAGLPDEVGLRGAQSVEMLLRAKGLKGEVEEQKVRSRGPGAHITVWAEFENGFGAGSAGGRPGVRIEQVAESAFANFAEWFDSDATVDPYLADQLLLPAAMAEGLTTYTTPCVTRRLVTMAWVVKQFLPIRVTVLGQEGSPGTVAVER